MTSDAVNDPNAAVLAQLQLGAAASGMTSPTELLAYLNAEPDPDPLTDVDYTGDLESDATAEASVLLDGFRQRADREHERVLLAIDSEYWFCVCFRTRADKDAFLVASGLSPVGDKYLDGYAAATTLGVTMPDTTTATP